MIFLSLKRRGVCVCVYVYTSSTCSQAAHGSVLRTDPSLSFTVSHGWELGALWTFPEPVPGARWAHGVLSPQDLSRAAAAPQYLIFQPLLPRLFVCELFAPNVTYDPGSSNKSAGLCQWWTAASTLDQTASGKVEARLWSQASRETSYRSK